VNFTSYAQNFEDVLLWRALKDVEHGRYLDVGAQDPVVDSVSLAFYERGWRGVHVEPTPGYAAKLREARPDEMVVEAAVTDAPGPIDFYEIVETGLSTGKRAIAMRHGRGGFQQHKISVPTVRLDRLFDLAGGPLHWLKIDVEGMEADVLRSWGDHDARPWILVIESTAPMLQNATQRQWLDQVLPRGYDEVLFDGLSRYFLHQSQAKRESAFRVPANVFDRFSVARHHFSASALRSEADEVAQQLRAEEAAAAELRAQLADSLARLDSESAASTELRSRVREIESKILAETTASAELRGRLAEANQRHSAEMAVTADLRAQLQQSRESAAASRRDHLAALAELGASRSEVARLEERAAGLRERLERSERDRESLARERVEDLKQFEQRAVGYQSQIGRLQEQSAQRVARLQATIDAAAALAVRLASERPGHWVRIGQALGLATRSPAVQDIVRWGNHQRQPTGASSDLQERHQEGAAQTMFAPPATDRGNPYLRADSLVELLDWHDVDFVRCAYVTILGRQPDPDGESHYTRQLRQGRSKLEILWHLRRSKEGRRHDPGIAACPAIHAWNASCAPSKTGSRCWPRTSGAASRSCDRPSLQLRRRPLPATRLRSRKAGRLQNRDAGILPPACRNARGRFSWLCPECAEPCDNEDIDRFARRSDERLPPSRNWPLLGVFNGGDPQEPGGA